MFCAQCGRAVEAGAAFCTACGALVAPAAPAAPAPANQGHGMEREHWLLVLLLNAVTLGLYGFWWWWSRADAFNRLRSGHKFHKAVFLVLLLLPIADVLQLYAWIKVWSFESVPPRVPIDAIYVAGIALGLIAGLCGIVFAFIARRMLLDHYHSQGRADVRVNALWTLLFNIVYLQYKLRELP